MVEIVSTHAETDTIAIANTSTSATMLKIKLFLFSLPDFLPIANFSLK